LEFRRADRSRFLRILLAAFDEEVTALAGTCTPSLPEEPPF
jgi:hypothetical protein